MISRNVAIGAGVLALAGLSAVAHYSSTTRAAQPAAVAPATPVPGSYLDPMAPAPAAAVPPAQAFAEPGAGAVAAPAGERVVYRDRVVYRTRTVAARPRYYVHTRSKKHSAAIIGGSAIGGAGVGALVGGKKGALIGGLVGGTAGTVYDRKTHKKVVQQ
jgi:uncharacterized protein YcfJ